MIKLSKIASQIDSLPRVKSVVLEEVYGSIWLQLDRGKTRYVLRGNAEAKFTVVVAPDPPNTIEQMRELIGLLEPHFRVLAFDTLGFGYSSVSYTHLTLPTIYSV